jgi:hypothetical protein
MSLSMASVALPARRVAKAQAAKPLAAKRAIAVVAPLRAESRGVARGALPARCGAGSRGTGAVHAAGRHCTLLCFVSRRNRRAVAASVPVLERAGAAARLRPSHCAAGAPIAAASA